MSRARSISPPERWLQCPRCKVKLPLADGITYQSDYDAIADHSKSHDPPVVGAWDEAVSPGEAWDNLKKDRDALTRKRPKL